MDPVDYDFVLTKDDEQARRIASLALAFMSSDFIQDEIIWRSFYPDLEKADSGSRNLVTLVKGDQ